jgi:hypothetical protein
VALQAVRSSVDARTKRFLLTITAQERNFHEIIANRMNELDYELGVMIQSEAQMTKNVQVKRGEDSKPR